MRVPEVSVTCAGRTDAGVHARGQVCHVDLDALDDRLLRRINGVLPPDVRVRAVSEAPPGFDARYAAIWRRYAYRVADAPVRSGGFFLAGSVPCAYSRPDHRLEVPRGAERRFAAPSAVEAVELILPTPGENLPS